MATEEDIKKPVSDEPPPEAAEGEAELLHRASDEASEGASSVGDGALVGSDGESLATTGEGSATDGGGEAPAQLGYKRYVYAAYFAGAIGVAFLLSKAVGFAWMRLSLWKPTLGEPHDDIVMPIAGAIGALVAYYYWRDIKTRTLAEEVASELAKVTWPSRESVINSTFVVIVTTLVATTFFALMDKFWGFVTDLVYGA